MSTQKFGEAAKRRLDLSIHQTRDAWPCSWQLVTYDRLIRCLRSRSDLLSRRASHRIDVNAAIVTMVRDRRSFCREPESWVPARGGPWTVLGSLAEHLFARYPMALFTVSAWFGTDDERRWYKHLGAGQSIRTAGVPMNVTRALERFFLKAPHHLTVTAALRWAQVRALGGTDALARAILATRLGRSLDDDAFWETAVKLFVDRPWLDVARVAPIVAFAARERYERRSDAAIEALFAQWHRGQGRPERIVGLHKHGPVSVLRVWPRSRVGELALPAWRIRELTTSQELFLEGAAMRHCVFRYVQACVAGRSTIWSMTRETSDGGERVLTIEVDPTRRQILQAKRKCNAPPGAEEKKVIARWAEREGLVVPDALRA